MQQISKYNLYLKSIFLRLFGNFWCASSKCKKNERIAKRQKSIIKQQKKPNMYANIFFSQFQVDTLVFN